MIQNQEQRHVHYDRDLELEAYQLSGIVQKFPNHFHECYVIGFVEGGKRHLWCKNQECDVSAGDLILFNPRDNHCCAPVDGQLLDYRAVNIQPEIMEKSVKEITGRSFRPYFTQNVVFRSDITRSVAALYDAIKACVQTGKGGIPVFPSGTAPAGICGTFQRGNHFPAESPDTVAVHLYGGTFFRQPVP